MRQNTTNNQPAQPTTNPLSPRRHATTNSRTMPKRRRLFNWFLRTNHSINERSTDAHARSFAFVVASLCVQRRAHFCRFGSSDAAGVAENGWVDLAARISDDDDEVLQYAYTMTCNFAVSRALECTVVQRGSDVVARRCRCWFVCSCLVYTQLETHSA